MKTLILNGSPRKNGDTAFLLSKLKEQIDHEIIELRLYDEAVKIQPCVDCRACWAQKGCAISDDMNIIYADDFDNIIIASPLYISSLTPPLHSLASRLQAYYCAKRFLKDGFRLKEKKAALILVGGGDGSPESAIKLARWVFGKLNAMFENHMAFSLKTDDIPASEDMDAIWKVRDIAVHFNVDKKGDNYGKAGLLRNTGHQKRRDGRGD